MAGKKDEQVCCCEGHHRMKPLFIGIFLFVLGLVVWAAKVGLYAEEMMWANLLMAAGLMFAIKGIIMFGKR
jgi:hypothetical protein